MIGKKRLKECKGCRSKDLHSWVHRNHYGMEMWMHQCRRCKLIMDEN